MAHMFPEGGPTKSTTSPAERHIYALLQQKLDDNYYVFHSVPWSTTADDGTIIDGEVDFIVLHPEYGILLFEVKGGTVEYDGSTKEWSSVSRGGVRHTIKDPFLQARECAHRLKKYLTKTPLTKPYASNYRTKYAAWFPDIPWEPGALPLMHVDDEAVLDREALKDPGQAIQAVMLRDKRRRPMSPEAVQAFREAIAPNRTIKAKLRDYFEDEQAEFIRLLDEQYHGLLMMAHYSRVIVQGAAGTGKTVIALEKARQLARQGLDVLFLCSNVSLARWLLSMVREEPEDIQAHVTVHNMEQLCTNLSGQAGLLLNDPNDDDEVEQREELGDRTQQFKLASLFSRSINALDARGLLPRYDAILVDEGQDFERPLWGPLYKMLRDRRNGKFIAFYDPAQRDGDGDGKPAIPGGDVHELFLTRNCRNTQEIFTTAQQFYTSGNVAPTCIGPAGQKVAWIEPATIVPENVVPEEREAVALEMVLDNLVNNEGILPRDVLVVIGRSQRTSTLFRRKTLGAHLLNTTIGLRDPNFINMMTIRSVKGLESPVVVLAELEMVRKERMRHPELYKRLMYIASSRAIHHLVILGTPEEILPSHEQGELWATHDQ